jgi:hypothetical protein
VNARATISGVPQALTEPEPFGCLVDACEDVQPGAPVGSKRREAQAHSSQRSRSSLIRMPASGSSGRIPRHSGSRSVPAPDRFLRAGCRLLCAHLRCRRRAIERRAPGSRQKDGSNELIKELASAGSILTFGFRNSGPGPAMVFPARTADDLDRRSPSGDRDYPVTELLTKTV